MDITVEQILNSLRHVNHPSKGTDIVTLNMVQDVSFEGNKINFTLIFSKSTDPFISSIKKACLKVIGGMIGNEYHVQITEKISEKNVLPEFSSLEKVKNIIAVASGKGGVGKSTISVNLAIAVAVMGAKTALLDADIYGPSVPIMTGAVNYQPVLSKVNDRELITPLEKFGIKLQSLGFFINSDEAVIWRGPMASSALKQVINQTYWGELDYLFIDLPPGTGDIHLTIVQEMPVTGAVIVSTPQQIALADVIKAVNMFKNDKINIPILGLVENMAWFTPAELPDNKYYIFGKEGCKRTAEELKVPLLGQIPIVQSICENSDKGLPPAVNPFTPEGKAFASLAENVLKQVEIRNKNLDPSKKVETHK